MSSYKDPSASSKLAGYQPAVLCKLSVRIRPYRSKPPAQAVRSDFTTSQEAAQSQTTRSVALINDNWPSGPEPAGNGSLPRRKSSPGPLLMSNALPRKDNLTSPAPTQPNPVLGTYTRPGAARNEQVDTRRYAVFMEDIDVLALRHILPSADEDTPQSRLPKSKSGLPETQKPEPGLEMLASSVAGSSGADDSKTTMQNMTATLMWHKGSDYDALLLSAKIDAMYGVYKRQDLFQFYGSPEAEHALQKTVVRTLGAYDKDCAIQFLRCKNPKRTVIFNILLAQRLAEHNHRFVVATCFVDQQEVENSCLDTVRGAIIPTIAYQICKALPEMRAGLPVCQGVVNKPPATQIEELIVKPLRRVEGSLPTGARKEIVVIIDGIDRVGAEWAGNLLELFAEHIEKGSLHSVKIVVTASRCLTYRTASVRKFTAAGKSILLS